MSKKKGPMVAVALMLLAGMGGFFGGTTYQKTQAGTALGGFSAGGGPSMAGQIQNGSQSQGMAPTSGAILSSDSKSLTIKTSDGSSKIVLLKTDVAINKLSKVSLTDLKKGENVTVFGTSNSDGSLTASSVRAGDLPDMGGPGGFGGLNGNNGGQNGQNQANSSGGSGNVNGVTNNVSQGSGNTATGNASSNNSNSSSQGAMGALGMPAMGAPPADGAPPMN
jgi:hypothetical protein